MKPTSNVRRRLVTIISMLMIMTLVPSNVFAASLKTINKRAEKQYNKKLNYYLNMSRGTVQYSYTDVTGDGVKDAIYLFLEKGGGSGHSLYIHTFKKNKLKRLLKGGSYGITWLKFFPKSKSFVLHRSGHGWEAYRYYKIKNGKYKEVAIKSRSNSPTFGPWYYTYNKKQVSKSKFKRLTKKLTRGKKITLSF